MHIDEINRYREQKDHVMRHEGKHEGAKHKAYDVVHEEAEHEMPISDFHNLSGGAP